MGTRGLIMIKKDKKYCLAIYNHWDSYPGCLGRNIVKLIRKKGVLKKLKKQLKYVKLIPKDEIDNYSDGIKKTENISVLETILNTTKELKIKDDFDFARDYACEWAYVIDYDLNTFEIYKGYQEEPLSPSDRFFSTEEPDCGHYPVKLFIQYDLDQLPSPSELEDNDFEKNVLNNNNNNKKRKNDSTMTDKTNNKKKKTKKTKKNDEKSSDEESSDESSDESSEESSEEESNAEESDEKEEPQWLIVYKCNQCQRIVDEEEKYCPSCGCKMKKNNE